MLTGNSPAVGLNLKAERNKEGETRRQQLAATAGGSSGRQRWPATASAAVLTGSRSSAAEGRHQYPWAAAGRQSGVGGG